MKWTITVEASGAGAEEEPATITAVMMSVPGAAPRIVELIVRASEEGGVSPRAALDIDFEMLAQAMSGVAGPSSSRSKDEPESHKRAAVSAPPVEEKAERPYRKMPDADEVKAVFLKLRSVGKVAQHYDVPRYTAQAWVDRLRRLGHLEEAKSSPRRRRGQ
ncbi:hypothetical protein AB0P36_04550 [Streptomyces flavidovirens]|uniref:hypothetical protein n=1 Tax=Streptomyces flavidovirens TaxID=67298 RepID=UPI003424501A